MTSCDAISHCEQFALFFASCPTDGSQFAGKAAIRVITAKQLARSCITMKNPDLRFEVLRETQVDRVTAGLKCAPDTSANE